MSTEIFRLVGDAVEQRLLLEDDGVTLVLLVDGAPVETLGVSQARLRFPAYADAIEEVIANRGL